MMLGKLTRDIVFGGLSAAARYVAGCSVNGPQESGLRDRAA